MNSYHLENEEVDETDQGDEDNQYNPPGPDILDPTGYWRWNIEFQQWIPTQPALQPDDVEQGLDDGVHDDDPFIATVQKM